MILMQIDPLGVLLLLSLATKISLVRPRPHPALIKSMERYFKCSYDEILLCRSLGIPL